MANHVQVLVEVLPTAGEVIAKLKRINGADFVALAATKGHPL
jgi:hypothetical protein